MCACERGRGREERRKDVREGKREGVKREIDTERGRGREGKRERETSKPFQNPRINSMPRESLDFEILIKGLAYRGTH